jgi:DNA-binding transcriptional ArsR family regulator
MTLRVDPKLAAEFGSATRVLTLAAIANAAEPPTAYRIAEIAQIRRTKVYQELDRLMAAGVVRAEERADKALVWSLLDADLSLFLRRRMRVSSAADLLRGRDDWLARNPRVVERISSTPLHVDWDSLAPGLPPKSVVRQIARSPEKDRALRALGLRTSYREGRTLSEPPRRTGRR